MYFLLPFPHKAPILEDINREGDGVNVEISGEDDLGFDF